MMGFVYTGKVPNLYTMVTGMLPDSEKYGPEGHMCGCPLQESLGGECCTDSHPGYTPQLRASENAGPWVSLPFMLLRSLRPQVEVNGGVMSPFGSSLSQHSICSLRHSQLWSLYGEPRAKRHVGPCFNTGVRK